MVSTSTGEVSGGAAESLNGFSRQSIFESITSRRLELIILPTEKCNLRCTYCYEDFAIGKMSEATQAAIERLIDRRARDLDILEFSWFGGEPLSAKDVILRLSKYASRVCGDNKVEFRGGMTTNAVQLSPSLLEELLDCNQNFFQVTLDGWKGVHDQVRRYANGRGSFDQIWSNLVSAKMIERDFDFVIRVHVRRDNINDLDELMRQLGREFGSDRRFRLDFQHLRNLGGSGGKTVKHAVTMSEMFEIEQRLRVVHAEAAGIKRPAASAVGSGAVKEFEIRQSSESAGSRRRDEAASEERYICYAAKPNSLLIRADGRLGKCTVAFDDDRNTIGSLQSDGTIQIDNSKLAPWVRGLSGFNPGSLACPLQGMSAVAPKRHSAVAAE